MKKQPYHKAGSPLTVEEIARLLDCPFEGDGKTEIRGVSDLEKAGAGDLVFMGHRKYRPLLDKSRAAAAIIPVEEQYDRIPVIKSENPHLSFVKVVEHFYTPYRPEPGIHPTAVVSPSAKLGKDVSVGPFVHIGDDVEIGDKTVIFPFVAIYRGVKIGKEAVIHSHVSVREEVRIGNRVIIHNNAVIGSDGFGYLQDKDKSHIKIPQVGTVIIEDDVEIGANTAVDRAALGETVIKKGTKIDNLVQVAHNVEIGENCILAGQTGISGSVKIGKNVIMGGQVALSDHVNIGDNVMIAGRTGVLKDIPANSIIAGVPSQDISEWKKSSIAFARLGELVKEIRELKQKVEELEKKIT
jgi:UDP-3-O-[3-hydroxymyristoyl] glucosamine N-acyltransferase